MRTRIVILTFIIILLTPLLTSANQLFDLANATNPTGLVFVESFTDDNYTDDLGLYAAPANDGVSSIGGVNGEGIYCNVSETDSLLYGDILDGTGTWRQVTWSWWFNSTSTGVQRGMWSKYYDGATRSWSMEDVYGAAGILGGRVATDAQDDNDAASYTYGQVGNEWRHALVTWNNATGLISMYVDGVLRDTQAQVGSFLRNNNGNMAICAITGPALGQYHEGELDEMYMWNRTLTADEIINVSSGNDSSFYSVVAAPPTVMPDYIIISNRVPPDIKSNTPFTIPNVTFTYEYFNTSNLSQPYEFNYSITSTLSDCIRTINGTCELLNATWTKKTPYSIVNNSNNSANVTYNLDENELFPLTENFEILNRTGFTIVNVTLTNSNYWHKEEFLNFSLVENYTLIVETPLNTTGLAQLYLANDSFTESANPDTNVNVIEICSITTGTPYNHTHANDYGHYLCYVNVINGEISGVKVTETMYLLTNTPSGSTIISGIQETVRSGSARLSANKGIIWSDSQNQFGHIHFFSGLDFITFQAFSNRTDSMPINSTVVTDTFQLENVPPTNPTITNPVSFSETNATLNITYLSAGTNVYYNITLLNFDLSFNKTLVQNNSDNLFYFWRIFDEAESYLGEYFIRVTASNSNGTAFDIEGVNITKASILNITALRASDNATLNSFNVNVTYADSTTAFYTTTIGYVHMDAFNGENHTIIVTSTNFTSNTTIYQVAGRLDNLTFALYSFNSLNIFFYDEDTLLLINDTASFIDLNSDIFSANYSTPNGTLIVDLLQPTNYLARYYAADYTERFYYFSVVNNSYQILNLYLKNNTDAILVIVRNIALNPVEGAIVTAQRKLIPSNEFITVEIGQTDNNGEVVFGLSKNDEWYRFIVTVDGDVKLITNEAYIIGDTVTLTIPGEGSTGAEVFQLGDIQADVRYDNTTNLFTFDFNDPSNLQSTFCLTVKSTREIINYTCTLNNAGTLLTSIVPVTGNTYTGTGTVIIDTTTGVEWLLDMTTVSYPEDATNLGSLGLLGQFLLSIVFIIILLKFPEMIPLSFGLSLLLGRSLNLTTFAWETVGAVAFVTLILTVWLGKNKDN